MSERALSAKAGSERLARRRRTRRRRAFISFGVLILILFGAFIWGLQQSAVRISHTEILGADTSLSSYAESAMNGKYFGIIPRDSIFFFPEEKIRSDILSANGDMAAVSISRNGFTGISIKIDYRVPIARWCGSPSDAECYFFDSNGLIYATTTDAQPVNSFTMYESLDEGQTFTGGSIGKILPNADMFPMAFDFARQLGTLGSPVTSVVIHDYEVDNYLASGTRVTYVLGYERDAFTALVSARDKFNLSDGSVDYIDLRFEGKMYLKKK